jgi:8-oxo-dGTP pyrophosphatase MutT (NUDIX family)
VNVFRFTAEEVRERGRHLLLASPPTGHRRSDDDLNPGLVPMEETPKPAAVLIPIIAHESEATVLLTLRKQDLKRHGGQVAFPGGRIDSTDEDAVAAALRETQEETGLQPSFVEPIGFLDAYLTRTNYRVIPVVAIVRPGFRLDPAADEVAAVFEVPLRFLMSPENHLIHSREWQGKARQFYAMPFGERYIWGATAGMLKSLYDRLYGEPKADDEKA